MFLACPHSIVRMTKKFGWDRAGFCACTRALPCVFRAHNGLPPTIRIYSLQSEAGGELLQTLPLSPSFCEQFVPVIWRVASFQHLAEHPICVVATFVGALGVLVVDPYKHDHFARR